MGKHTKLLTDVFCDVVESLTLLTPELADAEDVLSVPAEYLSVESVFSGPIVGSVQLAVARSVCAEIMTGLLDEQSLGDPDDDGSEHKALRELMAALSRQIGSAFGDHQVVDVSPTVAEITQEQWAKLLDGPDRVVFLVEDGPAVLRLNLREAA